MRARTAQSGMTLAELVIAIAIAAILVTPLAAAVRTALTARTDSGAELDLAQNARFAMQRMVAAVRRTAPHTLSVKAANTSADWLAPTMFCMRNATTLEETTTSDNGCNKGAVIATGVAGFSMQTYAEGYGTATVIEIQLTLSGANGRSIALTSDTRLGGGTL